MRQSEMWWVLATFGILGALVVEGRPAEDEVTESKVVQTAGDENALQSPDPFAIDEEAVDKEDLGRFLLTQVGTMMCYRTWEEDPSVDFHLCNVCYNETHTQGSKKEKEEHIKGVETCFNKFQKGTDFEECKPMLRDPSIPNKVYDINASEPPFDFPFRNFARCGHGVVFKQETAKCVSPTDVVTGSEAFLEKFACLMKNLVVESRRFSEANLKELLGSIPQSGKENP